CIHPSLELDDQLSWQLRLADRWLRRFDRSQILTHWQVLLEVLIADLAPSDRAPVAQNLQLSADGIDRLNQLETAQSALANLSTSQQPSQIVQQLKPYELPLLMLVAVKTRSIRRQIWRYLTTWAHVKPLLDGNDLKALGYKPGRQFKQILDDLLAATLDGRVHDRAEAEAYLAHHYALNS
ncbi:MAG: poly(A) polymerase, partial [Phormidesmis sp. CAN_BIN44]|nr:poly(A) polymerase [Phormidesmis sp. CAN_BIN44]